MTNMGNMGYFFYPLSNSYSVKMARVIRMTHIANINLFAADYGVTVEYVALNLRRTSREATALLYSPALDPHLEKMTQLAIGCSVSTRCSKPPQRAGQRLR